VARARSIELARQFRKAPTPTEALLWGHLRDVRLEGLKFRRQHPLGGCIADFYCAEGALVVEVDGAVHEEREQREQDRVRDEELRSRGLTILRFTNTEVQTDLAAVLSQIVATARGNG